MTASDQVSVDTIKDYFRYRKNGFLSKLFKNANEYGEFLLARSGMHKRTPEGDGHPVLVLPAFTSNDLPTRPLRRMITEKGYKSYAWRAGFNLGMTERKAEHLHAHLKKIYEENGNQKVTIIGHSLGGFYARALAQEYPDMVRAVITINTPFGVGFFKDETPPLLQAMIEGLSHEKYSMNKEGVAERLLTPPPVPTTSIFSKIDTVAGWKACLNPATPLSENIEIPASHLGSVWHKDTVEVILDRLAQPEGQWKPHKKPASAIPPANPNWKPTAADWKFFPGPAS